MSFVTILETIFLGPLKLLFEIIFQMTNNALEHPGLSIIFLSLVMNFLVLPLYKRADAMQEEAREMEAKLHDGVAHIKKVFSGDEKMMMLQAYYRQNNYKPTSALNGSVSLLLEIPFFMAAYQFLSHLKILEGATLGPITDLGMPDGLLVIGGISINLLPIIMTLVNVISCALYLKGFPLKTKIQLYGMALFFLVFLYNSPSGLVFYWTLNNVFSLVKTIFYKIKNPRKVLSILASVVGWVLMAGVLIFYTRDYRNRCTFLIKTGVVLQIPILIAFLKTKIHFSLKPVKEESNKKLFVLGSLFLTVFMGALIPSTFIAACPQEYVDINNYHNPIWYIVSSGCMAIGTFLVWMRVFYWLASAKGKAIFDKVIWILCGVAFVNYMFFGTKLGLISSTLQYENGLKFARIEKILNPIILVLLIAFMLFVIRKWKKVVIPVLLTAVSAFAIMSGINIAKTKRSLDMITVAETENSNKQIIQLSKTGQNVVVLLLDRSIGEYIPYFLQEKPELAEQFAGFTYYSNTISFGGFTNFGSPAVLGGYEYTPVEMNKRNEETLVSKHNEALKVMPVLFAQNGFDVTVCDPPYANYQWIPDLSVFKEYPNIKAYNTKGVYGDPGDKMQEIAANHRNFFCFSIMKSMPVFMQSKLYSNGTYNQANASIQVMYSVSVAKGVSKRFMDSYNVLANMPYITKVTENDKNTFLFLYNEVTHNPMLLQQPNYVPAEQVDNTTYDQNTERYTVNGITLNMTEENHYIHYQTNMAALLRLGQWFDYLRENDVYDNTKIIIVADHGSHLFQIDELVYGDREENETLEYYYPLLMVKDFNSTEFTTSDEFMTNGDVPTLATEGVIENPKNPFTGKEINDSEKTAHDQYIILSGKWDVTINDGTTFLESGWASVKENLWDRDNWTFYEEEIVLDEHEFPK